MTFEEAQKVCHARVLVPEDFTCIQLVVGAAGEKSVRIFNLDFQVNVSTVTVPTCFYQHPNFVL